jgi:mRNA interferase RelE/StbE
LIYQLYIERSAQKALSGIQRAERDRVIEAVRSLSAEPRPSGRQEAFRQGAWRIRVGAYRIIYEIQDERLVVLVIQIGHRREVYRR